MFWSCSIYEINPEFDRNKIEEIFESGKEYVYGNYEGVELFLFVDNKRQNEFGEFYELGLDILTPSFYLRNRPTQRIPTTATLGIQFFKRGEWPDFIAIFGARKNTDYLRHVINDIYSNVYDDREKANKHSLNTIIFRLREKEDCINGKFPDMKELAVESIGEFHVDKALIKGHQLEESPYFEQWVRDDLIGGNVRHFGFNVMGETVIINTFGNMYSRQGKRRWPTRIIAYILNSLLDCEAIRYQSAMTQFTQ